MNNIFVSSILAFLFVFLISAAIYCIHYQTQLKIQNPKSKDENFEAMAVILFILAAIDGVSLLISFGNLAK